MKPLHFWCFKVLPLVYDNSLSYYEQLCKLTVTVNEIIGQIDGLDDIIAEIQKSLQELEEGRDQLKAEIQAMLDAMQKQVDGFQDDIDQAIEDMQAEIEKNLQQFMSLIIQMEQLVSDYQTALKAYVDKNNTEMWNKLVNYVDSKTYDSLGVGFNPVYGKTDTVKQSMLDTYVFDSFGIPANYLKALHLTAKELQDMNIPASEWDTKARVWLWFWWTKKNHIFDMANPWTGAMDDPRHVLTTLFAMHQEGVTAKELQDANITVEELDDSQTTAYDFGWSRGWFEALRPNTDS